MNRTQVPMQRDRQVIRSAALALMAAIVMAAFLMDSITYAGSSPHDLLRVTWKINDLTPRADLY
jgi:hypothetical protein